MLRQFGLLKARRVNAVAAILLAAAAATGGPAAGQLVLGFQDHDAPYIMCKVFVTGSNVRLGSGETANTREAGDRFGYYAKKWAEETGQKINYDCERYERITDEWRARWAVGSSFVNDDGETITIEQAPFLPDDWASTPTPEEKERLAAEKKGSEVEKVEAAKAEPSKSAAQLAAEEAAKRRAEREAEFQAKQADYERKLAEQQKMVEDYKKAQEEVERTKAANQAKAEEAAAKFKAEQDAYAEQVRHHEESEAAARELMAAWDKRHGLSPKAEKASTDEDANRCVTTAETQLNATFKGNTAASIVNGCGKPVDVRICLMTTHGWNCGVQWGVGSQAKASHSSFDATGPVFVDARVSGVSRSLASPK
jgi:hypothetical protein